MKKLKRLISSTTVLALLGVLVFGSSSAAAYSGSSGALNPWGDSVSTSPNDPTVIAAPSSSGEYVALGDSVAAGAGLPPSSDNSGYAVQCQRSSAAYPHIVAQEKNLALTHKACGGATVGDLFTRQSVAGPDIPAQLDGVFTNGTPELITLTAGANDTHWADFIRKCYAATCGTRTDNMAAYAYVAALKVKLHYAFATITARSSTPPPVIVTGYYNPFSERCIGVDARLSADEITWLGQEITTLNNALREVSSYYPSTTFVPIDFSGHDLCSSQSWLQGPSDVAPFHPTVQGQAAIARSVLAAI